jgi:M6 family metalloprotease-like protein
MIRKIHFIVLVLSLFLIKQEIIAVPAYPKPIVFRQPDGTILTVTLQGDERAKWAITSDGYTVLFNKKGFYEYAVKNTNNDIVVSGIQAKDPAKRSQQDADFLSKIDKKLKYSPQQVTLLKSIWQIKEEETLSQGPFPTTGDRKLICILIGYTDNPFTKTQSDFNKLLNQVGYSLDGASGSVKDFYLENSYGQFNLTVDVAGPYTASHNMAYYGANDVLGYDIRPRELVTEAVNLANSSVNYADYDNDNDGSVDGVYVIYAGYGEEAGAPANTIWAHAWNISPLTLDGKIIESYSCSSELRGNTGTNLTRIGVICHEFGHVLGAPDFYDTDYSGSGGDFEGTGYWDVMASGSWNNNGATPPNHNAYTKVVCYNWAAATTLTSGATITLYNAKDSSNSFYKFNTTTANEYFIMENRHQVGFDVDIPGEGLIIYHVHKNINVAALFNVINASHPQMMYPVCASATSDPTSPVSSYGSINSGGCPFPGTSSKTSFTDATLPSSKSWAGANTNKPITNISHNSVNKTITITFMGGGDTDDPTNFAAEAISSSQIDLSWNLNAGRNVLLAWSSNGVFGTPADGVDYSTDESIPGGGTVLYAGSNEAFSHTSLDQNTRYYYKIWTKVEATPTWSTGVTSQAQTLCSGDAATLPFSEQFSATTLPGCWTIEDNIGNGQVWKFGTFTDGLSGTTGNYAYLNSDSYSSGYSQNTDLITPTFDFTDVEFPTVEFVHYFESYSGSGATFSYSTDNGSTWNVIQSWTVTTTNPVTFDQLISEVSGYSQVKFKWNYTGTYGYWWCIDDIEINNNSIPPINREAEIKRLPDGYSPAIDGQADILWNNVEAHDIDLNFTGEIPTLSSATWKAVWNDTSIFVLVEVNDNSFWPTWLSGLAEWQSDKSELYFDVNDVLKDGGGPVLGSISGHYYCAPNFSEFDQGTVHLFNGAYVAESWSEFPASYVYEYSIPFSSLTDIDEFELDPYSRTEIGFDVYAVDLDEGQFTRNRAVWANTGITNENWNNMDNAGIIQFVTDEIEPPVIEPPQNLTAQVINHKNVKLEWDGENLTLVRKKSMPSSLLTGYAIYRDNEKIAQTFANTYTDENLEVGTYDYYVTSVYTLPNGESDPSNEIVIEISYSSVPSIDAVPSMNVKLYPVPAKDKLNVVLYDYKGSVNLEIYNLLGKVAYQGNIESQETKQSEQIMLNDIAPGIYYLKVSNKDKTNITKFTIE